MPANGVRGPPAMAPHTPASTLNPGMSEKYFLTAKDAKDAKEKGLNKKQNRLRPSRPWRFV
jgi:hypothetical protein